MWKDKLNKKQEGYYQIIDEEILLKDGSYEGELAHDNILNGSIIIFTEKGFKGNEIKTFFISYAPETPWKVSIRILADVDKVYVSYQSKGDTVEADDINKLQRHKADNSIVEQLEDSLKDKADKSDIEDINTSLNNKADKDKVVTSVNGEVGDVIVDGKNYDVEIKELQDNKADKVSVGNLENLATTNKDNLVEAINEVNSKSGVSGTGVRSSTIVIANYDSHENSKTSADIVINKGENAAEKINEAIQSLKGTGGEVKLMEGNYNLEYGIAVNIDGVHLTGIPKATVLVQNKAWQGNPFANDSKSVIDMWRESDLENVSVEISNIYVKGANISDSTGFEVYGSSKVINCISENNGRHGFSCSGSSKVTNCISEGNSRHGFYSFRSSTISNCISENSGENGFRCTGSSKVTNCISEGNSSEGFQGSSSSKVTNCISENNGKNGFYCSSSSKVTNCISESNGDGGFRCAFSFKGICSYNTLIGDKLNDDSSSPAIVQYNIIQ